MIKQLIEDLAFDRISLGQALTRAKLIASRTQNTALRDWVNQELQGYSYKDKLPTYRSIPCQTSFIINLPFGRRDVVPIAMEDKSMRKHYNFHQVYESITEIDSLIKDQNNESNISIQLATSFALILGKPFEDHIEAKGGVLHGAIKKFQKGALQNIIELTKHTLIDTLLELDHQFPNLENEFMATNENIRKVDNIVNNHIYGSNNPVNVATGQNVVQQDITTNIGFTDYSKLERLGVQKEEIDALQTIVNDHKGDKSSLKEKVMKWVTPVITNVIARGLYDNAPAIMDFATKLIE